jgi:phage gp16-like protein
MLWSVGRVRSAADLDLAGRQAVLAHLVGCGWRDTGTSRPRPYKKGSQAALIRHLWTRLAQAGQVQDGSDRALRAFVRSQSAPHHPQRIGWDDPRLLPRSVAGQVIEHLKQWCERAGVER